MNPKYFVGQTLFLTPPALSEGLYYRHEPSEHLLLFVSDQIGSFSVRNVLLSAPLELTITVKQNVLLILARFGELPWYVSWYHNTVQHGHVITKQAAPFYHSSPLKERLLLLLIEPCSGTVQGVRHVALSPSCAHALQQAINAQNSMTAGNPGPIKETLSAIRKRYPKVTDLLVGATAHMVVGPTPTAPETHQQQIIIQETS